MFLISHADDLGLHPEISHGIMSAVKNGLLTQVSVITNNPESHQRLKSFSFPSSVKTGLHICLTEGRPLSPFSLVRSLISEEGFFYHWTAFIFRAEIGGIIHQEIYQEMESQLQNFVKIFGFLPHHLDSHHHVHYSPVVQKCLYQLSKKYDIPHIRYSRRLILDRFHLRSFLIHQAMRRGVRLQRKLNSYHVLDGILDPLWIRNMSLEKIFSLLPNQGSYQVLWHLADGPAFPLRHKELRIISSPHWTSFIKNKNIRLGSYSDM